MNTNEKFNGFEARPSFRRRHAAGMILAGAVLLALASELIAFLLGPTLSRDGIFYLELAQIWHDTGNFQAVCQHADQWLPPLAFYAMKLLMDCGLPAAGAGISVNMAAGCLLPLIAYGIAMELCRNKKIALGAALLIAVNPSMADLAIEPLRDMLYLAGCGGLIYFLLRGIRRRTWLPWAAAGGMFAVSFLIRDETLEFLPVAGLAGAVLLIREPKAWKKYLRHAAVFAFSMAAALVLLSYVMGIQHAILTSYGTRCRLYLKVYLKKMAVKK